MALGNNIKKKELTIPKEQDEKFDQEDISNDEVQKQEVKAIDEPTSTEEESLIKKSTQSQYCVFASGKEEYAVPIDVVKEVVKYSEPAPIPQMPNHIIGMTNIRGNIYGVMDIDVFFQSQSYKEEKHKYLLVIDHDIYKMAIRIYNVPDSLMVEEDQIEQLNSTSTKSVIGQKYLRGIIKKDKRMIVLFDILEMISSERFTEIA